jgi:murein DD-endopeptidase MepM/ murein hydrolase activator NlpD
MRQAARIESMEREMELLEADLMQIRLFEQRLRDLLDAEQEVLQVALGDYTALYDGLSSVVEQPVALTYRSSSRTLRWYPEAGAGAPTELDNLSVLAGSVRQLISDMQQSLPAVETHLVDQISEWRALPTLTPTHGTLTSPFGPRRSPFGSGIEFHDGIDLAAPLGTAVVAAGDAVVAAAGWKSTFGRVVILDHGNGITTLYAHLAAIYVEAGQTVERGTTIGAVGSSGRSTGPHLHFTVSVDGRAVDPMQYLRPE